MEEMVVTSDKIKEYEDKIKAEKKRILEMELEINGGRKTTEAMAKKLAKRIKGATITRTRYKNFKLQK